MSWKLGDKNKTIGYLLPFLHNNGKLNCENFFSKSDINFPVNHFVNVFNKCEEFSELDQHLFLLYKFSPNPIFQNFESKLSYLPEFVQAYDPDKYHRMFVFKLDDEYIDAIQKFREGKFSKIKERHKDIIMKFHRLDPDLYLRKSDDNRNNISGTLYKQQWKKTQIEEEFLNSPSLHKSEWVRLPHDAEYTSIPNDEHETYLEKYKINDTGLEESSE
jgi:hypothetical protein